MVSNSRLFRQLLEVNQCGIPLLVEYFTHRYAKRAGKRIPSVTRATLAVLQAYDWPGNVRELQNIIERAVIVSDASILSVDGRWLSPGPAKPSSRSPRTETTLAAEERQVIEAALAQARGRVAGPFGAATKLGVPSSTVESKIKSLHIDKRRFKTDPSTQTP